MNDEVKIRNDKNLRRKILRLADSTKGSGGVRGRILADILDPYLEDDAHLIGLCQDLINAGLLNMTDLRRHKCETRGLDSWQYTITADGTALLAEGMPINPLVEDNRIHPLASGTN